MKEIRAYQNTDGTYIVEIFDRVETTEVRNHTTYRTTTESKTIIDRASISITAYNSLDEDNKLCTIIY
jgi:hypothetical protein